MSKITFSTQAEKDEAIAKEVANPTNPQHLADLREALVKQS